MAKLIVKEKHLESEVHFSANGGSYKVILKEASQEQLKLIYEIKNKDTGEREFAHLFEDPAKKEEKAEIKK